MDKCENCGKSNKEILLCEVLSRTGIVKMCESCARSNGMPVLRSPSDTEAVNFLMSREPRPPRLDHPAIQHNLVEKFNWHIQMARRRNGLSVKQVAEKIGETEEAIKKLESGQILIKIENDRVTNKLEQLFRINLKKESDFIGHDLELAEDVFGERPNNKV